MDAGVVALLNVRPESEFSEPDSVDAWLQYLRQEYNSNVIAAALENSIAALAQASSTSGSLPPRQAQV